MARVSKIITIAATMKAALCLVLALHLLTVATVVASVLQVPPLVVAVATAVAVASSLMAAIEYPPTKELVPAILLIMIIWIQARLILIHYRKTFGQRRAVTLPVLVIARIQIKKKNTTEQEQKDAAEDLSSISADKFPLRKKFWDSKSSLVNKNYAHSDSADLEDSETLFVNLPNDFWA